MAKEVSTGIRSFVKDSLNQYYKRFQIKLDDNPSKNSQKTAIKIHNDGSIYVYDIGNYTGSAFDNASTLQEVIKNIGGGGQTYYAGDNIEITPDNSINALGYTYNKNTSSFAEGYENTASGNYSHAEGKDTSAFGDYSHVEGYQTEASGIYNDEATYNQHVEGFNTKAYGNHSHAEGNSTSASGNFSHAEGWATTAEGNGTHAEGQSVFANGFYSHAEGSHTQANNYAEHAEGKYNQSHEGTIHSIGIGTGIKHRKNAFEVMLDGSIYVYGLGNYDGSALTNASTLQEVIKNAGGGGGGQTYYAGDNIEITPDNSINALGYTYNPTNKSITIGYNNGGHILTNGNGAFAGGYVNSNSSIESKKAGAFAYGVAYQGGSILANGDGAIAAGFVQGANSVINASANGSFIFGVAGNGGTITTNTAGVFINGYANGGTFDVTGEGAHAEGYTTSITKAEGVGAHAEGYNTTALNEAAHAEGKYTKAINSAEHAEGKYNQSHKGKTIHSIGIGGSEQTRKNAFEVMQDGSVYIYGLGNYDGSTLTNASTLQDIIKNNYYTKNYIDTNYYTKSDINTNYYTKSDINTNYYTKSDINTNYYTKSDIDTTIENVSLKAGQNISIYSDKTINALGYVYDQAKNNFSTGNNLNLGSAASSQTAIGKYNNVVDDALFIVGNGDMYHRSNAFVINNNGIIIQPYINMIITINTGTTITDISPIYSIVNNNSSGQDAEIYFSGLFANLANAEVTIINDSAGALRRLALVGFWNAGNPSSPAKHAIGPKEYIKVRFTGSTYSYNSISIAGLYENIGDLN